MKSLNSRISESFNSMGKLTLKEAIEYSNGISEGTKYKEKDGWVYRKTNNDKRFKDYKSVNAFLRDIEEQSDSINAITNFKKVKDYIFSNGLTPDHKSTFGSYYFYTEKGTVRVSTHGYMSQRHDNSKILVNIYSYDKNGHVEMIRRLGNYMDLIKEN